MTTSPRPVTVQLSDDQPCCPRCGQQALMHAKVPHGWTDPDGSITAGTLPVIICEQCDAGQPHAAALITYFHVHGQVTSHTVTEFAALAQAWADSITLPPLDHQQLDAEIRAWRDGTL